MNECLNKNNFNEKNISERNMIINEGTNINLLSKKPKLIKMNNYEYKSKINFDNEEIPIKKKYIRYNSKINSPINGNIKQINYILKKKFH